eukprot:TRINITY_DN17700_c0_g1_i1.p1 TRINITY_DN17700_c0_g1~~TRINITY_DN17700_c0_g1_i1.p1  ORF type:complete len:292 (+),score=24.71 TRINITY_DN17700_c0_g1_i1:132-1007(+)
MAPAPHEADTVQDDLPTLLHDISDWGSEDAGGEEDTALLSMPPLVEGILGEKPAAAVYANSSTTSDLGLTVTTDSGTPVSAGQATSALTGGCTTSSSAFLQKAWNLPLSTPWGDETLAVAEPLSCPPTTSLPKATPLQEATSPLGSPLSSGSARLPGQDDVPRSRVVSVPQHGNRHSLPAAASLPQAQATVTQAQVPVARSVSSQDVAAPVVAVPAASPVATPVPIQSMVQNVFCCSATQPMCTMMQPSQIAPGIPFAPPVAAPAGMQFSHCVPVISSPQAFFVPRVHPTC